MIGAVQPASPVVGRLPRPRMIRIANGRPAVLLGYVRDIHGRPLWAEIVTNSQFVRPEAVKDQEEPHV